MIPDHTLFAKHRKVKQMFLSVIFIFIIIGGWFFPVLGYFIPACMIVGIGIASFSGRTWCDWYCPRGSFLDYMIRPISPGKEIPAVLKSMPTRFLVIAMLMTTMIIQIIKRWPDPFKIGEFFVTMLSVTTGLAIIAALFFHQRSWCYLCPIGTLSNLAGRNKRMLKIDSGQCVECKVCAKVCPMQIKPFKFKAEGVQIVKDPDCLKCSSCVEACPKKALSFK